MKVRDCMFIIVTWLNHHDKVGNFENLLRNIIIVVIHLASNNKNDESKSYWIST